MIIHVTRQNSNYLPDPHHIFVLCPRFTSLRDSYSQRLKSAVLTILDTYHLTEQDRSFIIERVFNLFSDSNAWPSCRSGFYLGILPRLVPPPLTASIMHSRLAPVTLEEGVAYSGRGQASGPRIVVSGGSVPA